MNDQEYVLVRLLGHSRVFVLPEKLIGIMLQINMAGIYGKTTDDLESQGIYNVYKTIHRLKKWGIPIETFVENFNVDEEASEMVESHRVAPGKFPKPRSWGIRQRIEVIQLRDLKKN